MRDLHATRLCGRCGYDLTGLPPAGRCPECGHLFDRPHELGVKPHHTPLTRGQRLMQRIRTAVLGSATLLVLGLMLLLWLLGFPGVLGPGILFTVLLGLGTATSFVYHER